MHCSPFFNCGGCPWYGWVSRIQPPDRKVRGFFFPTPQMHTKCIQKLQSPEAFDLHSDGLKGFFRMQLGMHFICSSMLFHAYSVPQPKVHDLPCLLCDCYCMLLYANSPFT